MSLWERRCHHAATTSGSLGDPAVPDGTQPLERAGKLSYLRVVFEGSTPAASTSWSLLAPFRGSAFSLRSPAREVPLASRGICIVVIRSDVLNSEMLAKRLRQLRSCLIGQSNMIALN